MGREEGLPKVRLVFPWEQGGCPKCGRPLKVRLTRTRAVVSLAYGPVVAVERQGYCQKHPRRSPARSEKLRRLVAPGCNIAYDVIAHVGWARYLECRHSEEIQLELARRGVELSVRTIRELSQKYVAYVQAVHRESIPLLRRAMRGRGGYILHIDGTCEEGSRVLLVCFDSLSGQVLESRKISSENQREVRAVLQGVRRDWGVPLAIVHDLRTSLIQAAGEVFAGVPQFVCHFHFAADVGKDILSPHVDRLRRLFRRSRVRPKLRTLCRALKEFAAASDKGLPIVGTLLGVSSTRQLRALATPESIQGTVQALASWILAFSHSGDGYGFPFDVPYLTLYDRIREVQTVLRQVITSESIKKRGPLGSLLRLKEILDRVVDSPDTPQFRAIVSEAKRDQQVFQRLRHALRICPADGRNGRNDEGDSRGLSSARHQALLQELRRSLKRKRGGSRKACQIVVTHLDKYWDYLFGHLLRNRTGRIVVPRTNNVQESLFRTIKRQCRRLHGRGHLCHDLDNMYEAAPLVLNLKNADYCETVYGGTDAESIATRFSLVDPNIPAELLKTWRRDKLLIRLPRKLEKSKDLPKQLVRFIKVAVDELRTKDK